jgi:hypothetical protein
MGDTIHELRRLGIAATHDDVDAPAVGIPYTCPMTQATFRPQGNEMPRVIRVTFVTVDVAWRFPSFFGFIGDTAISLEV